MEKAVLKQDRERIIQREIFSAKFKTLSNVAGSNLATAFALLKMSFYDVKSQQALLECKGLKARPSGKRTKYNEYLDYVSADELRYLNKGLDAILAKIGRENNEFSGFPFIYNEIIEQGKKLRYDFYAEFGKLPEEVAPELQSVKKVKKAYTKEKVAPKNATFIAESKKENAKTVTNKDVNKDKSEVFIVKTADVEAVVVSEKPKFTTLDEFMTR